jgi:hypothetical protein
LVVLPFEEDVAQVQVAVRVEVIELNCVLVRLDCFVILLQAAIGNAKEEEYLAQLCAQTILQLFVIEDVFKVDWLIVRGL